MAEPADDNLVINEDIEIVTRTAAPAHLSDVMDEVMSGWLFRGEETRAMQLDDFDNPGMIFVEQAEEPGTLLTVPKANPARLPWRIEATWQAYALYIRSRRSRWRSAYLGNADQRLP